MNNTIALPHTSQDIANDVNEKHMVPWSEMCVRDSIENTPLSPFVYPCQLENLNIKASGGDIPHALDLERNQLAHFFI